MKVDDKPLIPILEGVLARLQSPECQAKTNLIESWPSVVGNRFAARTKPSLGPGGKVTVWVDDSTLAFELSQRYRPVLLKRLRNQLGEDLVKDLRFFVGELH